MARNTRGGRSEAPPPPLAPESDYEDTPLFEDGGSESIVVEETTTRDSADFEYPPPHLPSSSPDTATTESTNTSRRPATPNAPPPPKLSAKATGKQPQKKADEEKVKRDRLVWTFEMEEVFFQTMVNQVRLGKRADSGYKSEAWTEAYNAVSVAYTGRLVLLTVEKLKSKLSNYQQLYKDWRWLVAQSGFGLHPETRVVTASEEA